MRCVIWYLLIKSPRTAEQRHRLRLSVARPFNVNGSATGLKLNFLRLPAAGEECALEWLKNSAKIGKF
jgi:hypothetical protein